MENQGPETSTVEAKNFGRRLKCFRISADMFAQFCLSKREDVGWVQVISGAPEGSRVCGVDFDLASYCWRIYLEHKSFPEVPDGEMVPDAQVVFRTRDYERLAGELRYLRNSTLSDLTTINAVPGAVPRERLLRVADQLDDILRRYFPEGLLTPEGMIEALEAQGFEALLDKREDPPIVTIKVPGTDEGLWYPVPAPEKRWKLVDYMAAEALRCAASPEALEADYPERKIPGDRSSSGIDR